MAQIFVSHSSADNPLALRVRACLGDLGYDSVFLDVSPTDGLIPGAAWRDQLFTNLDRSDALVFIGTPTANASQWCHSELALARWLRKPILSLLFDAVDPHELVADIQGVNLASADLTAEVLRPGLVALGLEQAERWDASRSPFPGLRPFDESYAPVFFGRERQVDQLRQLVDPPSRARQGVVVPVLGPSGSGKSSLVRAGPGRRPPPGPGLGRLRPLDPLGRTAGRAGARARPCGQAPRGRPRRRRVPRPADHAGRHAGVPAAAARGQQRARGRASAGRGRPGRGARHPHRRGRAHGVPGGAGAELRAALAAARGDDGTHGHVGQRVGADQPVRDDRGAGRPPRTSPLPLRPGPGDRGTRQALAPRARGRPAAAARRGHRERRRAAPAGLHPPADDRRWPRTAGSRMRCTTAWAASGAPSRRVRARSRTAPGRRPRSRPRSCRSSARARTGPSPAWPGSTPCHPRSGRSSTTSSMPVSW